MIWKGPFVEGIRQSSLSKFEDCTARFLLMIKGHRFPKRYDKKIFCGDLWHTAMDGSHETRKERMRQVFEAALADSPRKKNEIIEHAKLMNGFYDIFWKHFHPDRFKPAHTTEYNFRVQPLTDCPVFIKGTMDGITLPGTEGYIREWKVRGTLNDYEADRLGFSFQTGIYHSCFRRIFGHKAEGTQYCKIQRPMGNRNAPRKKKTETKEEFYERLFKQARENIDDFYKITPRPITDAEIDTFENDYLRPALNYLGWWWYCLCMNRLDLAFHRRIPWGLYSRLRHWESDDYDAHYLGGELPHDPSLTSKDF